MAELFQNFDTRIRLSLRKQRNDNLGMTNISWRGRKGLIILWYDANNCPGPSLEKKTPQKHQETRMHSSRMRTARSSSRPGGSPPGTPSRTRPPRPDTPGIRHPPPGPGTHREQTPRYEAPPGSRPPCGQNDRQVQKYYLAPNFVCGW